MDVDKVLNIIYSYENMIALITLQIRFVSYNYTLISFHKTLISQDFTFLMYFTANTWGLV